jgi:transcriptional regulator with XRE-family HTH domain
MATATHWTARSIEDFVFKMSADFVFQLVKKMDIENLNQKAIADRLGVSVGRVSQVLNNPGNLTLKNCVQYARILGMKAGLLAYDDGDPENNYGPINSEIFYKCWQSAGRPRDFFEFAETSTFQAVPNSTSYILLLNVQIRESDTQESYTGIDIQRMGTAIAKDLISITR